MRPFTVFILDSMQTFYSESRCLLCQKSILSTRSKIIQFSSLITPMISWRYRVFRSIYGIKQHGQLNKIGGDHE